MDSVVFLIDDLGRVESILEKAFVGTPLKLQVFNDTAAAKRRLLEQSPTLIVSLATFQNNPDGGFRLATELSGHDVLSAIPLVLVSEQLSEEIIRRALDSGAKALVPWPVTIDSLKNRLKPFLESLMPEPPAAAPVKTAPVKTAPVQAAPAQTVKEPASSASSSNEEKIHVAQQLLAKVLHNLKTSALLEVVDLEDVPRVVMEITRSVTGIQVSEQKAAEKTAPKVPANLPKTELTADLDRAFGLKKK